jgi:hypothetical protein
MSTYFTSYYKKQFYSLSGYFHISSSLTFDALQQHQKINEWLEYNKYYMKLCPSQEEEMVQVGALCFSSIFIYREDLKQSIIQHPLWTTKHTDDPPIFDIYLADFTGPSKKTKMLFISAEKSKQNVVATFFRDLYDGSKRDYPNGAMMLFVPLYDGVNYSPEQRNKIIYNHESFLGAEEAISIGGLADLNTPIKIKGGHEIPLRLLLKSLPATQGMSRSQLFQFVEPNISGVITLATFQSVDKEYIEKRKLTLEAEIRKIIEPGEETKVFKNNEDGLWFGGVRKNKNGKVIAALQPSQSNIVHLNHINSILRSPKKRPNTTHVTPPSASSIQAKQPTTTHPAAYPRVTVPLQAHQDSYTIPPQINEHFQQIANEFQSQREQNAQFDHRINSLERTTNKIDQNIETMLSRFDVFLTGNTHGPSKQRKTSTNLTTAEMMIDEEHPPSLSQQQYNGAYSP